ncbi:unnamed protein product [Phaeothamnion confervicola]
MKLLITGASGKLGGYLMDEARARGFTVEGWSRRGGVDLTDTAQVLERITRFEPDAVIHSAAMSTVAECFRNPEGARQANPRASGLLAKWCGQNRVRLVAVSTDMVFDGEGAPYDEDSEPNPCTEYGRSKVAAEQAVLENQQALVVRVALLCGRTRTQNRSFFDGLLDQLQERKVVRAFADEWRTPLFLGDAASALLDLAQTKPTGVLHLGGPERLSRFEMCQRIAALVGAPADIVEPSSRLDGGFDEPRQRDLSLGSRRVQELLPHFRPRSLEQAFL